MNEYPTKTSLKDWYRELECRGNLAAGYVHTKPWYSEEQKRVTRKFLALPDRGIQAGVKIRRLPGDLAQFMLAQTALHPDVDKDEEFEADIDL